MRFTVDSSKTEAWNLLKREESHIKSSFCNLCGKEEDNIVNSDFVNYFFGVNSPATKVLMDGLQLDSYKTFTEFIVSVNIVC